MAKNNIVKFDTAPVVFTIIGISSQESDYRLSWSINEHLGLSFAIGENLVTKDGKEFTCFVNGDDDLRLTLVSNRCDKGFLLEKFKKLDFILKFEQELDKEGISAWLRSLRKTPFVSAAFMMPIDKQVLKLLG